MRMPASRHRRASPYLVEGARCRVTVDDRASHRPSTNSSNYLARSADWSSAPASPHHRRCVSETARATVGAYGASSVEGDCGVDDVDSLG